MATRARPREAFRWVPGLGPDAGALARLRAAFPQPSEPMGEAWFMGARRRMFTNLQGDLDLVTAAELEKAFSEIASGTGSFGRFEEWSDWFHHMLGRVVPRAHEM